MATKTRYACGISSQGFHRRPLPMLCLRDSIRDDDPSMQCLLRAMAPPLCGDALHHARCAHQVRSAARIAGTRRIEEWTASGGRAYKSSSTWSPALALREKSCAFTFLPSSCYSPARCRRWRRPPALPQSPGERPLPAAWSGPVQPLCQPQVEPSPPYKPGPEPPLVDSGLLQ